MEITFPIEFVVAGTPVSHQAARNASKIAWKKRVKEASNTSLPSPHFVSGERVSATLYYFPDGPMQGDVDNIVKLVLDALRGHVILDDNLIERVVVQKFEPGRLFAFRNPSTVLSLAMSQEPPILYVRMASDGFTELDQ